MFSQALLSEGVKLKLKKCKNRVIIRNCWTSEREKIKLQLPSAQVFGIDSTAYIEFDFQN